METSTKIIGEDLRRIFAAVVRRPMGWNLIDAFSHLEEREETLRDADDSARAPTMSDATSTPSD